MTIAFTGRSYSRLMLKHGFMVAALCVAVAGCGGGKQGTPPPAAAAFATAANRICSEAADRSARLTRLQALRPPLGGEELYRRWLNAEEDALAAVEAVGAPRDEADIDPLVPLAIAEGKVAGYARRLGAAACVTMPG
jgi:hypothetical protein